ncbi:MAG: transposase, partial [Deltaproteobacteria bacterium]|nr:transposase [Deltaproteobacteria bacterium]
MLTVPWRRRWLLARRSDLAGGVLRVAPRRIETWYQGATGRRKGKSGAVTAIQRLGSALNLHLHFHIVHLRGSGCARSCCSAGRSSRWGRGAPGSTGRTSTRTSPSPPRTAGAWSDRAGTFSGHRWRWTGSSGWGTVACG